MNHLIGSQDSAAPIPEGIDVLSTPQGIVLRRRWFSPLVWAILIFVIVWDGFLVNWYYIALHPHKSGELDLMMIFFPLGHVAVGVGFTYYALCLFFNVTDIKVGFDRVEISTYPLPWPGSKIVSSSNLTGFSVKERIGNKGSVTFSVSYVDPQNKEHTLISRLANKDQADYICGCLTHTYLKN